MPRFSLAAALLALAALAACVPPAEPVAAPPPPAPSTNPVVGGAVMDPARTIFANASASRDHTTLMTAMHAAGLETTLSGAAPITFFAPTNAAFAKLPPTTVETLLQPVNRALLAKLLGYHVVPGRKTEAQIAADIRAGGGIASYRTVAGDTIRLGMQSGRLVLWDAKNGRSAVTQGDIVNSNGVMHVVDTVLLPRID